MKTHRTFAWVLGTLSLCSASAQTQLSVTDMKALYTTESGSCVSIHDPSVVYRKGMFYIWGSHLGVASSKDLVTFTPLSANSQTFARPDGTRCGRVVASSASSRQRIST